ILFTHGHHLHIAFKAYNLLSLTRAQTAFLLLAQKSIDGRLELLPSLQEIQLEDKEILDDSPTKLLHQISCGLCTPTCVTVSALHATMSKSANLKELTSSDNIIHNHHL